MKQQTILTKTWLAASEDERRKSLICFLEWLLQVNRGNLIRISGKWYRRVQYELRLVRLLNSETQSFHDYVCELCEQIGIRYKRVRTARNTYILVTRRGLRKLLKILE